MIKLSVVLFAFAITVGGCRQYEASQAMGAAKERYTTCLSQNSANPDRCEALRRAYEAEVTSYEVRWGGSAVTVRK